MRHSKFSPDVLALWLDDVYSIPMLPEVEVRRLIALAQGGCTDSRNRVVEANLRLVLSIAKVYAPSTNVLDELVAAGNMGLLDAVRKFDPDKRRRDGQPIKFATYATFWVKHHVRVAMSVPPYTGVLRLPGYMADIVKKRERGEEVLVEGHVMAHGVAAAEEVTRTKAIRVGRWGEDESRFGDKQQREVDVPDYRASPDPEQQDDLAHATEMITTMDADDQFILKWRYGLGVPAKSLKDIAAMIHRTPEGTRQRIVRALAKLRKLMTGSSHATA